jgi:hypothetical protein
MTCTHYYHCTSDPCGCEAYHTWHYHGRCIWCQYQRTFEYYDVKEYGVPYSTRQEAVALAAVHAGLTAGYGYPGTPSTEILEELSRFPHVYTEWSTNEKVALDNGAGAKITSYLLVPKGDGPFPAILYLQFLQILPAEVFLPPACHAGEQIDSHVVNTRNPVVYVLIALVESRDFGFIQQNGNPITHEKFLSRKNTDQYFLCTTISLCN